MTGWCCSKELSALLKEITFKHHNNSCFLNCLHSFVTVKNLKHMKMYVKIKTNVVIPSGDTKILELNQYQKSEKNRLLFIYNRKD